MKTKEQLEQENADLRELLRKTENQLKLALAEVARNQAEKIKARGEWHHRKFEEICPIPPMPDMSDLVKFK